MENGIKNTSDNPDVNSVPVNEDSSEPVAKESVDFIERAEKAAERLEQATKRLEEENIKSQAIEAKRILSGRSEAGTAPLPQETKEQRVQREINAMLGPLSPYRDKK